MVSGSFQAVGVHFADVHALTTIIAAKNIIMAMIVVLRNAAIGLVSITQKQLAGGD